MFDAGFHDLSFSARFKLQKT